MAAYVDRATNPLGRMKMCHMLADTIDDLYAIADKIGLKREWFQGWDKASSPHYDICKAKRELAISHGAVEIDRHNLGALIKRLRAEELQRRARTI